MLDRVIGKKQSLYLASNRASSCWSTLLSCILSSCIYFALFKRPRGTISRCLHLLIFGPEVPAGRWEEQGNNRILRNSGMLCFTSLYGGFFLCLLFRQEESYDD
ncbi:hypothetical protein BRADI_5g16751v3 [Brachypodium distachyon]|uniref:Uncharacterized protein n=1 Tax=Brachypodium distachyon TaxID=15368 RepID=A0A2K2CHQ2_BRADI|nr:hypothetical protein BRADI_5g16751v3 [Brachypodium distachyon]